jgi:glycyl-tRNA synthetase (EC 6.1.1.14)
MFVNFNRIYRVMGKLPIAVAQIGKVGRNEISPRQGWARLREFRRWRLNFLRPPKQLMPIPRRR